MLTDASAGHRAAKAQLRLSQDISTDGRLGRIHIRLLDPQPRFGIVHIRLETQMIIRRIVSDAQIGRYG